jgi:release factor glutamine methyltransferase
MTVAGALAWAARELSRAGIATAALDAELLLRHVLGWDRARIVVDARVSLADSARQRFESLVAERGHRRPLQHLTGTQAFWHHDFLVTPDVLVPRPETELLVETALAELRDVRRPVIVDVGTGSGCIALSLATERPDAEVHAIDLSPAALEVARENARRLGVTAHFHEGDLLAPVAALAGRVDLVASNPPYVEAGEIEALEPEVRDHEPRMALVPPGGAVSLYARLAREGTRVLRPGGHLVVEIGASQADAVTGAFTAAGLTGVRVRQDLAGRARVVHARTP